MKEVVVLSSSRTAIGDFLGALSSIPAVDLGITAAKSALEKAGIKPEQVDEVITGNVLQAGCKGNTGRQVCLGAGCPAETVAVTINQLCPSSMRALEIASQQIILGKTEIELVAGYESMSNAPYMSMKARHGLRMGDSALVDHMLYDGLIDAFNNYHMGITAENIADKYQISREEQDEWALMSHRRAVAAIKSGKFKDEITPVTIKTKKGEFLFDTDEHPRENVTMESLGKLKPAFKKDGSVTAGNASSLNDGGAALVLANAEKAKKLGMKPVARIISTASAAVDPTVMGMGVVPAVQKALKFAGLSMSDIGLWELNEAFAAQIIGCNRELKINTEIINVNGSGIALGHPVGQTGARIITTLLHEMKKRDVKYGVASLCAGGGPAAASVFELIK
ncbi:MAG TPA: acetyl-CoA C-acetyltransferase [Spirochaetota bacterium]|nr:acetyl-CoA C-acetyltransferase [Spirochaetota bacterium]HPJ34158.1 acetyl-CoA C-acetyltransferase [Spirochaetota bacterium]